MEEIEFALKTFFFNGEGLVAVCKQKKKVNQIPNILDSPFPFFKKRKRYCTVFSHVCLNFLNTSFYTIQREENLHFSQQSHATKQTQLSTAEGHLREYYSYFLDRKIRTELKSIHKYTKNRPTISSFFFFFSFKKNRICWQNSQHKWISYFSYICYISLTNETVFSGKVAVRLGLTRMSLLQLQQGHR